MSEHGPEAPTPDVEPERTGVEEVDEVIASLQGLDERPIEEHPAVFERAHERLRQALDGPAGT
jgi:hypothetical protein